MAKQSTEEKDFQTTRELVREVVNELHEIKTALVGSPPLVPKGLVQDFRQHVEDDKIMKHEIESLRGIVESDFAFRKGKTSFWKSTNGTATLICTGFTIVNIIVQILINHKAA